ncbi:MAG TPA: MFS transporter [Thermoplasmata archaeon]|nr:MFS transporter [Thermoplasmata archaeon]
MSALIQRVHRFYLYQACSAFALWIPFWAIWIRGHVGSDLEFTLVDVAFWVGLLVFQLPVGVIADRYARKWSIVAWEGLRCAGILGYGLGTSLLGYVAANVVWSLGAAFSIGTSAYLYEVLLEAGHESEFPRYIGRNTMIQLSMNAAGAFAGGLFVQATGSVQLTMLVGAAINLAAVAMALSFVEPKVERTAEPTYTKQLRQGLRIVRRREGIALLIGIEVFLGVTLYTMAIFRPIYLGFLGLSDLEIAAWISGFLFVAAIVSAFAGDLSSYLGEFGTLALLVALASGPFFGLWLLGRTPAAALLQVPIYVAWSLQSPMVTAFMNRRLEPGQRATVLSMGAFAFTLGLVIVEPLAGLLTTTTGSLLNLGLFLGIASLLPCIYVLARWRATVAPWPAVTPLPTRLVPGARLTRFSRLFERLTRLRP